ncbi:AAA family ATPase, partial [Microbacterium sp.]
MRPRLGQALADTRIVVVQGARQVGKSTLAEQVLKGRGGVSVTLDDPAS